LPARNGRLPALNAAWVFLERYWALTLVISVAIAAPCLWHRHIIACDLGSHTYNAWLAQLIAEGQAPGLFIVRQWNNVLFDLTLVGLGKFMSITFAERLATVATVEILFWGEFALVAATRSRVVADRSIPWFLIPGLAALTYGYSFEMG
jgi:hypothetical protein